jgi:hypothetical protein
VYGEIGLGSPEDFVKFPRLDDTTTTTTAVYVPIPTAQQQENEGKTQWSGRMPPSAVYTE